jgi:hypothetical protein
VIKTALQVHHNKGALHQNVDCQTADRQNVDFHCRYQPMASLHKYCSTALWFFWVSDHLCLSSCPGLHFFRLFFLCYDHPVSRDDRHLLAHAMASDFSVTWQPYGVFTQSDFFSENCVARQGTSCRTTRRIV